MHACIHPPPSAPPRREAPSLCTRVGAQPRVPAGICRQVSESLQAPSPEARPIPGAAARKGFPVLTRVGSRRAGTGRRLRSPHAKRARAGPETHLPRTRRRSWLLKARLPGSIKDDQAKRRPRRRLRVPRSDHPLRPQNFHRNPPRATKRRPPTRSTATLAGSSYGPIASGPATEQPIRTTPWNSPGRGTASLANRRPLWRRG